MCVPAHLRQCVPADKVQYMQKYNISSQYNSDLQAEAGNSIEALSFPGQLRQVRMEQQIACSRHAFSKKGHSAAEDEDMRILSPEGAVITHNRNAMCLRTRLQEHSSNRETGEISNIA